MKKICFVFVLLVSFFTGINVYAQDIEKITMDINISSDGTAHVLENWTVKFDENEDLTEVYKPYYGIGKSVFENFSVSLNGKTYTFIDDWDIDKDFDYKKYKNGINYVDEGIELCFGISEKGKVNNYSLSYDITNFIAKVSDADMLYWNLIPKKLADEPEKVEIKIHGPYKYDDKLPVWGFGNYGGYAYVYGGNIEFSTNDSLQSDEYMTLLVKYPKDTFTADNILDSDFNYYLDMANEGATSYDESSFDFDSIITILIFAATILGAVFAVKFSGNTIGNKVIKHGKVKKKLPSNVNYTRDIPFDDLFRGYWVSKTYDLNKKDTDFLGAILLKWLKEGKINIKKEQENGIFKKEKSSIVLSQNISFENDYEKEIYDMIYEASLDGILEAKEFKVWASDNYTKVYNWFKNVLDYETGLLANENKLVQLSKNKYQTTMEIKNEAILLKGLKRFLLDFSRIHEKNPIEVQLWENYLIFAQIFGIASKVAKDFRNIYPDVIPDKYMEDFDFVYFVSYAGMNSASSAKSKAESYNSGGGGFSSGGGGFGSFGGGSFGGGGR